MRECPWIGGSDEVAESIGVDLLTDALADRDTRQLDLPAIVRWHNDNVRRLEEELSGGPGAWEEAHSSLREIVGRYGIEDAFGDGDYWVVADSLSSNQPSIVKFEGRSIPQQLQRELTDWLKVHAQFKGVSVTTEDGDLIFEVRRQFA